MHFGASLTLLALGVGVRGSQAAKVFGALSSRDLVSKAPFTAWGQSKGKSSLKRWEMDTVTASDNYAA